MTFKANNRDVNISFEIGLSQIHSNNVFNNNEHCAAFNNWNSKSIAEVNNISKNIINQSFPNVNFNSD